MAESVGENRLARESSAYLRAHATDPVDWRPWGPKAFKEARALDRPVFLSVGYQSCHWCHVMQRESFREGDTAKILNRGFVPVKVDREIRPDVDALYMTFLQASTGSGGWPMSVWLTPDGLPVFGGTYFPPTSSDERRPSFRDVLDVVSRSWVLSRERTVEVAEEAREFLHAHGAGAFEPLTREVLDEAAVAIVGAEDTEWGGFGPAPKFPQASVVLFLAAYARLTGDPGPARAAVRAVLAMVRGGVYDQAGGGLFRYSVDETWLVPHFEKMLYDQGLLLSSLAALEPFADDEELAELAHYARLTHRFLERDLARADGGFASSLDAEADGVEGMPYAWTRADLAGILADDELALAEEFLGVTESGNWEREAGILTRRGGQRAEGDRRIDVDRVLERIEKARRTRSQPAVIDNVIVSWNAFAARGLIEAGAAFSDDTLLAAGLSCAKWLDMHAVWGGGEVLHAIGDRSVAGVRFLEDACAVAAALLAAAEHCDWPRGLKRARTIHERTLKGFRNTEGTGFVASTGETTLPLPVLEQDDSPTPSGAAMLADNVLALARFASRPDRRRMRGRTRGAETPASDRATEILAQFGRTARVAPSLAGYALAVFSRCAAE